MVTHQLRDAFYIARHEAVARPDGTFDYVGATAATKDRTEFLMLRDGVVAFEGNADELRATDDQYLKAFLS